MRETPRLSDKAFDEDDLLTARTEEPGTDGQRLNSENDEATIAERTLFAQTSLIEARDLLERYAEYVPPFELAVLRRSLDSILAEMGHGTKLDLDVIAEIVRRIKALPPQSLREDEMRATGTGS